MRDAFVAAACGADTQLQQKVASLLVSDSEAGSFIERPAAAVLAHTGAVRRSPRFVSGAVVGRYEILAFVGAGGMSEVYQARDTLLGRTVAIKIVTDPGDLQAGPRLLMEAQHASILNHPHSLDPTDLMHALFVQLVDQRQATWHNRAQFFATAAHLMRRILVDHARRMAAKRGGATINVSLAAMVNEPASRDKPVSDVLAIDQALERLAEREQRAGTDRRVAILRGPIGRGDGARDGPIGSNDQA